MAGSRYWQGADGRRYCYAKDALFECPHGSIRYSVLNLETGERTVTDRQPADEEGSVGITYTRFISEEMSAAAELLGLDAAKLAAMITKQHRSIGMGRARIDGKLTDLCEACGAKMERRGFHAWIEEPIPDDELSPMQRTNVALNRRLMGADGTQFRRVRDVWCDTKKECRAWAYEAFTVGESVAAEAS